MLPDPRQLTASQREEISQRAREATEATGFTSQLVYLNSSPCARHEALEQGCTACGVELRRHQQTGFAWLWFSMRGLLADSCGLGKTVQAAAVLAAALQTGELSLRNRAVIVCQASAVRQWGAELRRCVPALTVVCADGTPQERLAAYLGGWQVCVISDRTLAPAGKGDTARGGDVERLRQLPIGIVFYDDIDAMRNPSTRAAYAVRRLARTATRVYGLHATPLQKRLPELYSFLEPVGGRTALGTLAQFKRDYVSPTRILLWMPVNKGWPKEKDAWARDPKRGYESFAALEARAAAEAAAHPQEPTEAMKALAAVQSGRARFQRSIMKDTGGVQESRLPELKEKIRPLVLRRTVADLDDVQLPAVQEHEVWLDLLPQQKARYAELRKGILTRLRDGGREVSRIEAQGVYTRARQICSGLAALDDAGFDGQEGGAGLLPGDVSVKLDWCVDHITGDFSEEKAFCFVYYRPNVLALSRRLTAEGVGHVILWSAETDPRERARRMEQFRDDPGCRVVIATTTAERSLNLQAANRLMAVDTILNPARMTQILGRVRRMGSRHSMVVMHQLYARGTMEEDFPSLLRAEQALSDAVWDEQGEIYQPGFDSLSPRQQLALIARVRLAA